MLRPKEVVQLWVDAFNKHDVEAITALYHENATNHQVANEPVVGIEAIRTMFTAEFSTADMTAIVENIFEDGQWAILEWRDPLGLRGCGFFQVVNGKILFQRGYWDLDAQKDKLRKYAEYEDMTIVGEYSDEGFSGKNIQGRLEFQRMLNDIQEGKDDVSFVLVFKLSRFGRNAADVLNSLQLMQDFGVNLICVEDGIDSSKDSGKLMISVLSAVAEIERENIRTQTMAGREQKAREGKWNGGFAPYGYKLVDGKLEIAEDEVEVVRLIYDRYIHTNDGINGVAKYLNDHGYKKKIRQNGTIPGFSSNFVKDVLDNPVYMGKI